MGRNVQGECCQRKSLSMVAFYCQNFPGRRFKLGECSLTRTVRCHAALAYLINPQFRTESQYGMKCAPRFESTNSLEIFTFEIKSKDWRRRLLPFKGRTLDCRFLLGRRSNAIEGF